mgnify:CR=1 FL=1|tara:strand:- start:1119 stop:1415 length:297 start_codon:yes stop_codon:yes gene_type:complete
MTDQQKQEIIQELKDYIDSILRPTDNDVTDNDVVFSLQNMMKKYHLSLGKVAIDLGVSRMTLYRWLKKIHHPTKQNRDNMKHLMFYYQRVYKGDTDDG